MARKRWRVVLSRLLVIYALVEIAVVVALVSTIGWGWTVLVLVAAFLLSWGLLAPIAGKQLIRRLGRLRAGLAEPRSALSDGAMITLATGLVLLPGLFTTALGLLLLVPPIRAVAGPGLATIAAPGLRRRVRLITDTGAATFRREPAEARRDYIDGEIIDVTDVKDVAPRTLPTEPVRHQPPERP